MLDDIPNWYACSRCWESTDEFWTCTIISCRTQHSELWERIGLTKSFIIDRDIEAEVDRRAEITSKLLGINRNTINVAGNTISNVRTESWFLVFKIDDITVRSNPFVKKSVISITRKRKPTFVSQTDFQRIRVIILELRNNPKKYWVQNLSIFRGAKSCIISFFYTIKA